MSLKPIKLADGRMTIVPSCATVLNPEDEGTKRFAHFVWPQPAGRHISFDEAVNRRELYVYLSDFSNFGRTGHVDFGEDDMTLSARQAEVALMAQLFISTATDLIEAGIRAINYSLCDISGREVPVTTARFTVTRR